MPNIIADEKDVRFALFDVLKVQDLSKTEKFSAFSQDVMEMILSEAQKFAENVLFPLNLRGDKEGVKFEDGKVYSVPGTKETYRAYMKGGWLTAREKEDLGGQGMPQSLHIVTEEMFLAANFSFTTTPHVTHDAAKLIELFGTEEQKRLYMKKMYGGEWIGTMVMTEPDAGSDLGGIRTKAFRRDDGTYSIAGSKIFITNGDTDVTENIVHLILARIEGDLPGTRGLSIFIVPKIRVNPDGSLSGERNDVICGRIEEKLGLHASPTCQMSFGENNNCIGYLLGKEREGISIMFRLINPSRLGVGAWGTGTASIAYLHALRYAKNRIQGAPIDDPKKRVPIIQHPDIRRILMTMKSHIEGMRCFQYYLAYAMDLSAIAEEKEEKERWGRIVDLLMPVLKGYCSEKGFEIANQAIQVYGGYGLSKEYPVEQLMRDVRTGCIVEGTTAVQGMDLAFRKITMEKGKVFADFLAGMDEIATKMASDKGWKDYLDQFSQTRASLAAVPAIFGEQLGKGEKSFPYLKANLFLEAFGDLLVAWFLLQSAFVAQERLDAIFKEKGTADARSREALIDANADAAFFSGKVLSARHFISTILPVTTGKLASIKWNDVSAWEMRESSFGG
jgi:alkylation response protein AidB-like acyl-CoA dehydrogenase